jgi:beta-glucosidase
VLRLKFELGLFEHPYTEPNALTAAAPTAAQLTLAEELAARSIVLLKNNGVLPLAATVRRIALLGPLASDGGPLLGCWAQQGQATETQSIAAALRVRLPADVVLRTEPGCSIQGDATDDLAPALAAARESDLVILCVGEEGWMSGENASRSTLRLAGRQEELVQAAAATGKPVVLVLVSGRPIELQAFEGKMSAVVAAWAGGSRAAAALVDTLLGHRNPSGRLAVTWPRTAGQIPLYHNMRPRARVGDYGLYRDIPTTPLYEFGYGLSYTTFSYSAIRLNRTEVHEGERLVAEATITNTGACEGVETVFWFIRDPAASITRPLKELKHFEQASLVPGASCVFRFEIEPMRDLSFPDGDGRRILEPGEIILTAGGSTARIRVVR